MIQGLQVQMPGSRVTSLAIERVKEHERKAAAYEGAAGTMADSGDQESRTSMDPVGQAKAKAKEHTAAALYWQTVAECAVVGETYQLTEGDTRALLGVRAY